MTVRMVAVCDVPDSSTPSQVESLLRWGLAQEFGSTSGCIVWGSEQEYLTQRHGEPCDCGPGWWVVGVTECEVSAEACDLCARVDDASATILAAFARWGGLSSLRFDASSSSGEPVWVGGCYVATAPIGTTPA